MNVFQEIANLRFFIPKPFKKAGKHTDKYPYAVLEKTGDDEYVTHGKFPTEENAKLFLDVIRAKYAELIAE